MSYSVSDLKFFVLLCIVKHSASYFNTFLQGVWEGLPMMFSWCSFNSVIRCPFLELFPIQMHWKKVAFVFLPGPWFCAYSHSHNHIQWLWGGWGTFPSWGKLFFPPWGIYCPPIFSIWGFALNLIRIVWIDHDQNVNFLSIVILKKNT